MNKKESTTSALHRAPTDLKKALDADAKARSAWDSLTPLARNEWICWITYVKKAETRQHHINRTIAELKQGKRRPCCWMGCPHRNPNSKKWFDRLNIKVK
jgi:uncharacterized protein YdeI (YjbR/CyaY-like superfamily)